MLQVKPNMVACQWFKLLLDANQKPSPADDPLLAKSITDGLLYIPDDKTAQQVASDYLRCLYEHIIRQLKTVVGGVAIDQMPLHFELTLPATWSHAARDATRQAAIDAGIGTRPRDTLVLIDEPEAAAISAMKSTIEAFPDNTAFKANKSVLICDLGGGTSDCVTYRIAKVSPLNLEEACVGIGGKCGSSSLDRAFWKFLGDIFGDAFKMLPPKKTGPGSDLMRRFEELKCDFKGHHAGHEDYEIMLRMKVDVGADTKLGRYYDEDFNIKFTR